MSVDIDDLISRHHLSNDYIKRLGMAMYAFGRMEKQVLSCSNIIDAGSWVAAQSNRHHNAENKRQELATNARLLQNPSHTKCLEQLAETYFKLATTRRNKLFHSIPVSADGEVVQYTARTIDSNNSIREGVTFTAAELDDFTAECLDCASELLNAIHGFLNDIYQWKSASD